ncbi:AAA family ATPase [Serratia fonticola]|uniref:AAA family ATPase n=1 Tax=Serratia fonticola TaxID=47917 RepID=A0AAJ2DDR5_SERFO|nr:AAA family ATPase [Serratia fonticola]MDQ9130091.1 AAA family ATPase [Serratia fonticola]
MKSIVFFNNKGGVGKTTLLCNVAAYLSIEMKKKILVVDADPQCNTTSYCMSDKDLEKFYDNDKRESIESFLNPIRRGKGYVQKRITPIKTERFGFDLIAGDPKLALSEDLLATDWDPASSGKPRGLQTTLVFSHLSNLYKEYDFILYDVGPSLGALNRSVLISCDYFLIPMSVDVFSLMALGNIHKSLENWKLGIEKGLANHKKDEEEDFTIDGNPVSWKLSFIGYAMQQYKGKTTRGVKVKVNAFEKVARKLPKLMQSEIITPHASNLNLDFDLGQIENMNSLIPLSQLAHSPIFALKGRDGVVGAHFTKVNEARGIYKAICDRLLANLGGEVK